MKNITEDERKNTYLKVIATGSVFEIYEYEKMPILPSHKKKNKKDMAKKEFNDKYGDIEFDNTLTDRKNNQHKTRNTFRRLVTANFDSGSKFITLTFADDIRDVKEANGYFKKYIQRMRYRYGDFKYANVIQFQDKNRNGVVHYHLMTDLPYIPHADLEEIWGHGFVYINKIDHVDNVGAYMVRYMLEDTSDVRLMGEKSFTTSKNLDRPIEFVGDKAEEIIKMYGLEDKKTVYNSSYTTEHLGNASYKQYNLKR